MPRKTHAKPALLVRVLTEIGKGRISEQFIPDKDTFTHGETDGRWIKVNPAIAVCDTLIHEALHRLEPSWHENYVRRTTTFLMKRMSDEQIQQLFETYQQIAKRRRKRGRVPPPGSGLGQTPAEPASPAVPPVPGGKTSGRSD